MGSEDKNHIVMYITLIGIAALLVAAVFLLTGCGAMVEVPIVEDVPVIQAQEVQTDTVRINGVEKTGPADGMAYAIIQDNKTGVQYLVVTMGDGIAVTALVNKFGDPYTEGRV